MNLHDAAVSYAKDGWAVFPLGAHSKLPAISKDKGGNGFHDATSDPERIGRWWQRHPDHNIGLSVGASKLFVLDVDGERGENSLAELVKEHGKLPDTLYAITGKGFHFYFQHPDGKELGNSASKLGPGIDTRGFGGYTVLPPSVHPDGSLYDWKDSDDTPAPLPAWIIEKVATPVWIPATYIPSAYSINLHPYMRRVFEKVQAELQSAVHGERNNALNIAAKKLGNWIASNSIDRGRVEQELTLIAQNLGLGEREIAQTIKSGIEAGMATPAYLPEPKPFGHENTQQNDARMSEGTLTIQRGSSFGRKKVTYLWGERIPIGKLTVLAGPSGIGKSYLTLALAAHVTAGAQLLDDGPPVDGEVLFCSYEDDVPDTIGPRADLLGVDLDRTHFITGVETEHGERQFGPSDVPRIIDFLKGCPALKLIVIDPLGSFIGAGSDINAENEARAVLSTLVKTAAAGDCAVVVVAHYNKGTDSTDPLHRIAGSQGISALPRSVLGVEWGEESERLVKHYKASTSAQAATVGYRFDGKFEWTRVLREPKECKAWLEQTLGMNGGFMEITKIWEKAALFGLADDEISIARDLVNPRIDKVNEFTTYWHLP